jgi:hypothetical protein
MPLFDNEEFRELLSSLTLEPRTPDDSFERVQICGEQTALDVGSVRTIIPAVRLWYRRGTKLSFQRLVECVQRELRLLQHEDSERIAQLLLAIHAAYQDHSLVGLGVSKLNELLTSITTADLTQIFVAPVSHPGVQFHLRLAEFTISELDLQRLQRRCERAGSDYYSRWGETLRGRFAVERDHFQVRVLPLNVKAPSMDLADAYFNQLATNLFAGFWERLRDCQDLLVSCGAPFFDDRVLQRIGPGQSIISVFLNIGDGPRGWVAPWTMSSVMELAATDQRVPAFQRLLVESFGFDPTASSPFDGLLATFSRFMADAIRHRLDGHKSEAFLFFVIALDLAFGEKLAATESVATRASVVVHCVRGMSFENQRVELKKLYDARSAFVHRGENPPSGFDTIAEGICREVVFALLRLRRRHDSDLPRPDERWLKHLDYVATALAAGKLVDDQTWLESGIDRGVATTQG